MEILIGNTYLYRDDDEVLQLAIKDYALSHNVPTSFVANMVEEFGIEDKLMQKFVKKIEKSFNTK